MAARDIAAEPTPNGRALPRSIRPATNLTPNEMRALKAHTGRTLTELLGGDAEDMDLMPDRAQAMVWVALRRDGYDAAWEDAGDVIPLMDTPTGADPTSTSS